MHLKPDKWLLVLLRITVFNKGFLATPPPLHHMQQSNRRAELQSLINAELVSSHMQPSCVFQKMF